MIKRLTLKNFQSHNNSELNFDAGVNCIIGQSDSGKSAILRALNWIINNRPSGDAFITHGKNYCKVTIESDKSVIERTKDKNINSYIMNDEEFTAFKTDVPKEILEILNFNELNIQYQQDKSFLLSDSSGEIARVLNKVINLDSIDSCLFNIEKIKREYKNQCDNIKKNVDDKEIELKNYDWIFAAEKKLNILIEKEKALQEKKEETKIIKSIIEKKEEIDNSIYNCLKTLKYEKKVIELTVKQEKLNEKKDKYEKLLDIVDKISVIKINIHTSKDILKLENKINILIKNDINLEKKTEKFKKLTSLIENIKNISYNLKNFKENLKNLEKEYKKIKPDICPLCGKAF